MVRVAATEPPAASPFPTTSTLAEEEGKGEGRKRQREWHEGCVRTVVCAPRARVLHATRRRGRGRNAMEGMIQRERGRERQTRSGKAGKRGAKRSYSPPRREGHRTDRPTVEKTRRELPLPKPPDTLFCVFHSIFTILCILRTLARFRDSLINIGTTVYRSEGSVLH